MTRPTGPSPEQLAALLQAAIANAPAFDRHTVLSEDDVRWLGRADALLEATGAVNAVVGFRAARANLGTYRHSRSDLLIPLYDAYSRMELLVPARMQGSFIPGGDTWNGYAALVRVMQTECDDLLIVDPYLNSVLFTDLAPHANAKKGVRCLTAKRAESHPALLAASRRWASDAISSSISVRVRYAPPSSLHDRLIIVDGSMAWLISQSLKDIAKRSPASILRADSELGLMKANHYEELWARSEDLG